MRIIGHAVISIDVILLYLDISRYMYKHLYRYIDTFSNNIADMCFLYKFLKQIDWCHINCPKSSKNIFMKPNQLQQWNHVVIGVSSSGIYNKHILYGRSMPFKYQVPANKQIYNI